jgi:DNA-binding NarL/FixJ family response regulator
MENAHTAPTTTGIRAFVVEDNEPIRERLIALLAEGGDIAVIGEAATEDAAIEGVLALRPDVVTLDIHLGVGGGLRVIREVHKQVPGMTFVVVSNHSDRFYRLAFAKEGARRFLDKLSDFSRIKDEVIAACAEQRGHSVDLVSIR